MCEQGKDANNLERKSKLADVNHMIKKVNDVEKERFDERIKHFTLC